MFDKLLPSPSELVRVTMERPLGIIFEEDVRRRHAIVAGFVEGSNAEQASKVKRPTPRTTSVDAA